MKALRRVYGRARARRAPVVDAEERQWLERVAAACERILASDDAMPIERTDPRLIDDVRQLLAAMRARLAEG